jgi:hypothetical protein
MKTHGRRPLSDDELGMLMIVLAVAVGAATILLISGCHAMPETVTIRGPHGTKLADANTRTGDIRLTQFGLQTLTPRIHLPRTNK